MLSKDTQVQIAKLAVEAITGKTAAKKPFPDRANLAVRKLIREAVREEGFFYDCKLNETQVNTAARAIFDGAVDFEIGPNRWTEDAEGVEFEKLPRVPKSKAVILPGKNGRKTIVCLDAAKKTAPKKKTGKAKKAAGLVIGMAAALLIGGTAAAQCPGGNCQTAAGWYWPAAGWYWPGGYYYQQQARGTCPGGNCPNTAKEAPETPADAPEFDAGKIPEWEPESAEGAAEEAEPAENTDGPQLAAEPEDPEPKIAPPVCPLAAMTVQAINAARRARGLNELTADPALSAACERHSALMKTRGFGHAPDGGREVIAANYATPAATVQAWLNSGSHAAIILGPGSRIGIGVVGRYYTVRVR